MTVVVVQLTGQSLPKPEEPGSNPITGNFYQSFTINYLHGKKGKRGSQCPMKNILLSIGQLHKSQKLKIVTQSRQLQNECFTTVIHLPKIEIKINMKISASFLYTYRTKYQIGQRVRQCRRDCRIPLERSCSTESNCLQQIKNQNGFYFI